MAIEVDARQLSSIPGIFACGECTGSRGAELAAIEGTIAGLAAVGRFDEQSRLARSRKRWAEFSRRVELSFGFDRQRAVALAQRAVLCRCEDVPFAAVRECAGWEQAKMLHRCGMGACQGQVCGAASRALLGWGRRACAHRCRQCRCANSRSGPALSRPVLRAQNA